jgi:polysaccharide export outer membrane protein
MLASSAVSRVLTIFALLAVLAAAACKHSREFMWVDAVPKTMIGGESTFVIGPGDVIGVRVFNHEANSVERVRVRDDGRISLPLIDEIEVAGWEPAAIARLIELKLKAFITTPVVTVVVQERHPLRVSVLGKVARPGAYDLDRGGGVLHALAAAGGLTPFADEDAIFVLRQGYWADGDATPARIRFRYLDLVSGKKQASLFRLRVGDVVVVE